MDVIESLPCEAVRTRVTPQEWATRVHLAACYRLVALYGMSDLIYNHVSARVPGIEDHFLLNAYGMLYDEVTASSLVKVDIDGNCILQPDHGYSVNVGGFVLHSAIHATRPDVKCIIHTHTRAGTAISALREGLMPLSQTAMRFSGALAYHDFEGPALDRGERERVVKDLGSKDALILRNHGLLTCGASIQQAFNRMYWLEQACRIQVDALGCQRPVIEPTGEAIRRTVSCFAGSEVTLANEFETNPHSSHANSVQHAGYGHLEWPALLRKLDRLDPSYRS